MKVLHLIYSEQVAGAERYLLNLLPGLKQEGIECELICISPARHKHKFVALCRELKDKGVPTTLREGNRYRFFSVARYVGNYMKRENIIFLHSHLFKSDIIAVMVKKFFNKKSFLLSTKHGYQEKYLSNYPSNNGRAVPNAYYYISRYIARNINEHIAVSSAIANLYFNLKLTPQKIKYIHHGIELSSSGATENPEDLRFGSPQLITVGRIETIKGHRYLLDAMPEVIKKFPGVKWVIIGEGTLKSNLEKKAAEAGMEKQVLFLGFRDDPGIYISHSDIIVLPSLFEPFGLVFIEALALKIPVVAFDVPACNEIITHNESGILVPLANSNALAESICYLLQNPAERERLATNGHKLYREQFSIARMVKETGMWYRGIFGKRQELVI